MRPLFTPEELAELERADAEIDESDRQREYRRTHREQYNAYQRAYYQANKERIRAYRRAYRQANRERINAYQRAYAQAHKKEKAACGSTSSTSGKVK